jgi:hypothetical protein
MDGAPQASGERIVALLAAAFTLYSVLSTSIYLDCPQSVLAADFVLGSGLVIHLAVVVEEIVFAKTLLLWKNRLCVP